MGLDNMPAEIIFQICEFLCPHCCRVSLRQVVSQVERAYHDSIRAFSQTSRRHYDIAVSFIHHRPRRLLHRPGYLEECYLQPGPGAQVKEMAGFTGLNVLGDKPFDVLAEILRFSLRCVQGPVNYCFTWRDETLVNTLRTRLSLTMVPNIEVLCLNVALTTIDDFELQYYRDLAGRHFPCEDHQRMQKLRSLRIEMEFLETSIFVYLYLFLRVLFKLPALTDLTFVGGVVFDRPVESDSLRSFGDRFAGLKSLRFFHADIDWDDEVFAQLGPPNLIQFLIGKVSRLETFVYRAERDDFGRATGARCLSPSNVIQNLCCCQKFLRHLDLDFGVEGDLLHPLHPEMQITFLQSQSFEYLQTLKLEETVCYRHWFTEPYFRPRPEDNSCLSRLVGPSLRRFTIRMAQESRALDDLTVLAHEANQGMFLNLEAIEIVPPNKLGEHDDICDHAKSLDAGSIQIDVWDGTDGRYHYDDVAKSFEMLPKRTGFMSEDRVNAFAATGWRLLNQSRFKSDMN